jgi:hypothetical protein
MLSVYHPLEVVILLVPASWVLKKVMMAVGSLNLLQAVVPGWAHHLPNIRVVTEVLAKEVRLVMMMLEEAVAEVLLVILVMVVEVVMPDVRMV